MEYTIVQLARMAGVTARTLRYYDQIGLLKPLRITNAGYRIYGRAEIDRLQDIRFYRELDVSLPVIASILNGAGYDRTAALEEHLRALETERSRLDTLILTVKRSIQMEQGEDTMTDTEKFEGFKQQAITQNEETYGAETRNSYGDSAVNAAREKFSKLTEAEYQEMVQLEEELRTRLEGAVQRAEDPAGPEGQAIADLHKRWLSFTWPEYSPTAHLGLVQMYVCDSRFTAYYDRTVTGCAAFLRDAVTAKHS